jgi:CxxC-x17-CxxC domain-containing protein
MSPFNKFGGDRGGRSFGNKGFGGGNRFGGHGGGPRQMHQATCSKCGQDCEIPFKPTGDRPVFCSNCFKSQGGPTNRFAPKSFGNNNSRENFSGNAGNAVSKAQIDSLNAKLDKILSLLGASKTVETPKTEAVEVEIKDKKSAAKKAKAPAKKAKAKKK